MVKIFLRFIEAKFSQNNATGLYKLGLFSPIHITIVDSSKVHFALILPYVFKYPKLTLHFSLFQLKFYMFSCLPLPFYTFDLSHPPLYNLVNKRTCCKPIHYAVPSNSITNANTLLSFASCFVWTCTLVLHSKGRTWIEHV